MARADQPNLTAQQTATSEITTVDTYDTDPIDGTPIRTGARLAVDLRGVVQLLSWEQ